MQAIKQLLLSYQQQASTKIEIADLQLSWGAKLSSYQTYLNKTEDYETIYGIELTEDISPPQNYVAIDHHNELSDQIDCSQ